MRNNFFQRLFGECEGKIEIRPLPGQPGFFEVDDTVGIESHCGRFADANLYFGVGTRDGAGGGKANIISIPAVWADIDFKETPREILSQKLKDFPFKPSIIVKSGGGVHLYWILKKPAEVGDIRAVEDINHRIAEQLGGDHNSCDAARVLRVPDTLNRKYEPPRKCEVSRIDDFYYTIEDLQEILPESSKSKIEKPSPQNGQADWLHSAMLGVAQGSRNATAAKIAGYWINKVPSSDVLAILTTWNLNNKPPLSESDLQKVVKSVGRYEPQKEKNRIDISNVYTPTRMIEEYGRHLESLKKNRFITGIGPIDSRIRGVSGGEVLTIIARSGSFKTAILQNLLKNYVQNSAWGAVFFSLEMPVSTMTERYLQMIFEQPGQAIEELFSADDRDQEAHAAMCRQFESELKNLFIVPVKVGLSDIPGYVKLIESEFNLKIGVIGIDYLGLMDGPGHNEYEIISRLATGLKSTAKLLRLPVLMLCQTSRKGGAGDSEITLDMGRSSGQIEEAADFVLGLFQVEDESHVVIGEDKPPVGVVCKILKNRKGRAGEMFRLELNPNTFQIGCGAEKYMPPNKKKGF